MRMPDALDFGTGASRLRVGTLVRLRWLSIGGQLAAVLGVAFGLGFPIPLLACLSVIVVSAALNVSIGMLYPVGHRMSDGGASLLLGYDILQLAALLYLTGGLENPFSMLFLAPVMISAAALPPRRTLSLGVLAITAATLLGFWHEPLPWTPGEPLSLPPLYRAGIWSAILLGLAFIGVYAWRVTQEARELAQALAATEFVLAREQHLSQLDGLAAAAAHELGTPLATIALVAKELGRSGPKEGPIADDIALLSQQVARCRSILGKLTSLGNEDAAVLDSMRLSLLIEEVAGPHRPFDVDIVVDVRGEGTEPVCRRNPGLIYGLGNLIENAVDFARERVLIDARWDRDSVTVEIRDSVTVEIRDDGPGFPPDVLARLGEPYVTTRGGRRAKSEEGSGMGLGMFIAKTLLERSGASVFAGNASDGGASVAVRWSRFSFERGLVPPASALEPGFPL